MKAVGLFGRAIVAPALLAAVVAFLTLFPVGRLWLSIGFVLYALLLARYPRAWLVVVPAAMPVLDLAFFSGWFFFDEFDALVLLTAAILLWRETLHRADFRIGRPLAVAVALLAASYAVSAAIVLYPWPPLDGNAFASYYSPFNALRVAKGFVWPLLLLPHLSRAVRTDPASGRLLAAGLLLGLFAVCLVALYEHWLFVGLFNFAQEYRIIGPFSSMHTGDGHIDLWLAATIPLIGALFAGSWPVAVRVAAVGLGALAFYILLATASRGPFVATAAALFVLLGGFVFVRARRGRVARVPMLYPMLAVPMLAVLAALVAVPFVVPTELGARFRQTVADSHLRLSHWGNALAIRDSGPAAHLFGMGLGTFPRTYERRHVGRWPLARYSFDGAHGEHYLTLRSGDNLYIGQPVSIAPHTPYLLTFSYRTQDARAALVAPICEKWLLHSRRCTWLSFTLPPTGGRWKDVSALIRTNDTGGPAGRVGALSIRPVRIALFSTGATDGLSIDNIALVTEAGRNLIRNGDFSAGNDYWFWTVDNHLPWHTKNMAVGVLFDQGWLGLLAVALLAALAVVGLGRGMRDGKAEAVPFLAALAGYLVTGLVVSPFDQPRLAMLFYLLCFFACLGFRRRGAAPAGS